MPLAVCFNRGPCVGGLVAYWRRTHHYLSYRMAREAHLNAGYSTYVVRRRPACHSWSHDPTSRCLHVILHVIPAEPRQKNPNCPKPRRELPPHKILCQIVDGFLGASRLSQSFNNQLAQDEVHSLRRDPRGPGEWCGRIFPILFFERFGRSGASEPCLLTWLLQFS